MPAPDLEPMAQRYVTVHLSESTFKGLSGLLEDWIVGLARLWLTAYPRQLDAAYNEAAERSRSQRREEIQVPLSEILAAPDRGAIPGVSSNGSSASWRTAGRRSGFSSSTTGSTSGVRRRASGEPCAS